MANASVNITKFWDPSSHAWVSTPPTVNTGAEIGFIARMTNTSGSNVDMTLHLMIYNPNGTINDEYTYSFTSRPPGWFVDANMSGWAMQQGTYKGDAYAYVNGALAASASGVTIAITQGALSSKINDWKYWDPSAGAWIGGIPSDVLTGDQIGLQPYVVNQSGAAMTVHLDLVVHYPDGSQTTLHGSQVTLQDGGSQNPAAWAHWDLKWQATKVGDYTADIILYGSQGVLDQVTGIAVAYAAEGQPTPDGHMALVGIKDVTTGLSYTAGWPVPIDLNHTVYGVIRFFNDSTVAITVNVRVYLSDPSSLQKGLHSATLTIAVGGSQDLDTQNVALNKEGYWYIYGEMDLPGLAIPKTWGATVINALGAPPPQLANLQVYVTDSIGNPLPGVSVSLGSRKATTGTNGTVLWGSIPVGTYTLKCTLIGYQDVVKSVTLVQGDNTATVAMLASGEVGFPPWGWLLVGTGAIVTAVLVAAKVREKERR
jgi:hypothetical protein